MRIFSTFTGIGGFEIGISNAADLFGNVQIEHVGYSEIDKFAIQIYEKHFKGVKNYGDITKINAEELPDFDCLVGGFPCQAFSIAGRRKGFEDIRGTLFFDLARILRSKQPRLFVFENVKGLLNHDSGRTFRTIIAIIDELGYDCQWQVLNSKDFGVPQNRERIIIVGHLRSTTRPQVFPITTSDPETTNTTSIKGKLVDLTRREPNGYRLRKDGRVGTLDANYYKGLANQERPGVLVGTLRTHKDGNGFREMKSGIAPTIPARARNDGSGQPVILQRPRGKNAGNTHEIAPTLTGKSYQDNNHVVTESRVKIIDDTQGFDGVREFPIAPTLRSQRSGLKVSIQPVITPDRITKRQNGRRIKDDGEPAFTVTAQDRHGVLLSEAENPDNSTPACEVIRRLTPLECERLQAFPDNWTAEGINGPISDTQRYKMCGNAVTTNVIQAVFARIFAA